MIKVVSVNCPHCGHPLDLKPGMTYTYCPYCGVKMLLEDDSKKVNRKEVKKEIKIDQTYRRIDDAEILKAQVDLQKAEIRRQEKKDKVRAERTNSFLSAVGFIALILFCFLMEQCIS